MKKIFAYWEVSYVKNKDVVTVDGVEVEAMPKDVHFLGIRMGRCKFSRLETVAKAYFAESKASAAKSAATRAEKAKTKEDAEKHLKSAEKNLAMVEELAQQVVELLKVEGNDADADVTATLLNAVEATNIAIETAKKAVEKAKVAFDAFEVEEAAEPSATPEHDPVPDAQPEAKPFEELFDCLVLNDGEWWIDIGDKLISFASITREDGKAMVGETPLDRRSPEDFKKLAANVSAEIPTEEDFVKLEEVVQNLIKMLNELFANRIGLENQLVVTAEGKNKTYLGEYPNLLEKVKLFCLHAHKVIPKC